MRSASQTSDMIDTHPISITEGNAALPVKDVLQSPSAAATAAHLPHRPVFPEAFTFESGEPLEENPEREEAFSCEDYWKWQNRPAWQKHSALGPN
eukprot:494206-Prorocentrum_lima.AAC.1